MLSRGCTSLGFALRPFDPGQQDGTPAPSLERLEAMGPGAQQHEITGLAGALEPESARGPHMVELKATQALVWNPDAGKDADAVTRPDVRPHGRRDRIRP